MKLKNILLSGLSLALVAVVAIGGTVAYFTDRDSEANVFTVGDVKIELNEKFEQGAELIPGVKVEKEATITNTGDNDAWVWMTMAIPAALDNAETELGVDNPLHWNVPGATWKGYGNGTWATEDRIKTALEKGYITEEMVGEDGRVKDEYLWTVCQEDNNSEPSVKIQKDVEIEGVKYNVYTFLYNGTLAAGDTTSVGLASVYLDASIDIDPDGQWYSVNQGVATKINWNSNNDGNPIVYVSAYAMQTNEFDTVLDAYKAYNTQWGDNGAEYGVVPVGYQVNNSEEFAAAVENGETVIWLNPNTYQAPAAAKGKTLTINGTKDAILEVVPEGQSEAGGQLDYSFDGSTVTFNGITIKTNSKTYAGYARLSGTYNDCVIQNTYNLGTGDSAFYDCEINITNEYLRVGGASTAIFDGCTFNTDGRAILVFQDGTSVAQTVTVKDCTFNATAAAKTWNGIHVAAVSIDTSAPTTSGTFEVKLEGTNTVDSDFNGLWQIKAEKDNNLTVYVDDSVVHQNGAAVN